jgi:hypothetical protein
MDSLRMLFGEVRQVFEWVNLSWDRRSYLYSMHAILPSGERGRVGVIRPVPKNIPATERPAPLDMLEPLRWEAARLWRRKYGHRHP